MRLWSEIKKLPVVDGWYTDQETGFRAYIGAWANIGDGAKIGAWANIGAAFCVVYLSTSWRPLNPYLPGQVRLGCYVGDDLLSIAQHKTDFAKDITMRCLQ